MYYSVFRYLYSASNDPNKSVFSAFQLKEKVRLKARERDKKKGAERINERKGEGKRFRCDGPIEAKDLMCRP